MQAPRGAQPSCTNRPSSSSLTLRSRGRATFCAGTRCAVRPPGHRAEPGPLQPNAPRWSATMAGEVHPVPFRTRKLSPLAPMVLRSSPWESRTSLTNEGHLRAGRAPSPAWWRGPPSVRGPDAGQSSGDIGEHEWPCGFKCGCDVPFSLMLFFRFWMCACVFGRIPRDRTL